MRRLLTLLIITFTALMLELALIRWVAGQVRIVAYFPNLVLMGAFFGMGVGCLRQGRKDWLWLLPAGLIVLILAAWAGSRVAFTGKDESEFFWLLYYNLPKDATVVEALLLPLVTVFVLTAIIFIPLGQKVAEILAECQQHGRTLIGYSFDLGGSLLGVIVFTLLSLWQTFPVIWFSFALIPAILTVSGPIRNRIVYALCSFGALLLVVKAEYAQAYSPYYAINLGIPETENDHEKPDTVMLSTNGSLHQIMLSVGSDRPDLDTNTAAVKSGFDIPFGFLEEIPRKALVLGAGTGNDIAVLLRQGVNSIDAVEIDPVIIEYGMLLHPNAPYGSPKVHPHIGDARNFLNASEESYDLIIFGTLDSMTRLSALSNVRLDNFVYTRESMEAAKALLSDKGGIVLHFMVGEEHIRQRIELLLADVFKEQPVVIVGNHLLFNSTFLVGPAFSHVNAEQRQAVYSAYAKHADAYESILPTDDWPYLYLSGRGIGAFYIKMIASILACALVLLMVFTRSNQEERKFFKSLNTPMFLFGAAFLILNTKSVTEIGLVWGNTWMTNSITFASILSVLLLSTLFFAWKPLPLDTCFGGLFASLLILYFFPLSSLLGLATPVKLLCTIPFIGLPFFFAGACFAGVFKSSSNVATALGWNVIGALCGGLLEYLNMVLGFKALYLLALLFYLIAYLAFKRKTRAAKGALLVPA